VSYDYNSWEPVKVKPEELTDQETELLRDSKTFCIYPWIHLHTYPTGETWPCCHAEMAAGPLGTLKEESMFELQNSERMRELRLDMLEGRKNSYCTRCYEQEDAGFFSGRKSANKHHGHHIKRIEFTEPNGRYLGFTQTYWDVRFSNLCNLKCRSCGHIFSSQWYKDQIALAGSDYAKTNPQLTYAGKNEKDALWQLMSNANYVEQIYFAGGEPLVMEEHYAILEELIKIGRTDVRLIYNTNFTQVKLKDKRAFDMWKHFPNVSVGASLDGMGAYAEYIRSGTRWADVEQNIQDLRRECPHVDFYISATLSIFNALHITDFHRDWCLKGWINPQDFNINILQDPAHYRIDIATPEYKDAIRERYNRHLEWLGPQDHLNRASTGYRSALNFLNNDNSTLLQKFWDKTQQLDSIRNENVLDYIPELKALQI